MSFTLPPLPYAYDALEPYLDAQTMRLHHTQHHQAYVDKLNRAIKKAPQLRHRSLENLLNSLETVPKEVRRAIRNHGGGHYNHSLLWTVLSPDGASRPEGELAVALEREWGGFGAFHEKFSGLAAHHFASGWAWLCLDAFGRLVVKTTADNDCPISEGLEPLFVMDLWEHAFYLKFHHQRERFIEAMWKVVNWSEVQRRYGEARHRVALSA